MYAALGWHDISLLASVAWEPEDAIRDNITPTIAGNHPWHEHIHANVIVITVRFFSLVYNRK